MRRDTPPKNSKTCGVSRSFGQAQHALKSISSNITAQDCSLRRPRRSVAAAEDGGLSVTLRCNTNLSVALLCFERRHVNGKTILYIGLKQPVVGFVDLLDWDDFYIGGYIVLAAEVEHFLGLWDAADE